MAFVTRTIANTGAPLLAPDGTAIANTDVTFTLETLNGDPVDVWDATTYERVVGVITATTDATGVFSVDLWPNNRGNQQTQYLCHVDHPSVRDFRASVDEGESDLTWVAFMAAGTPLTAQELSALTVAQAAITASQEAAAASAEAALASETAAGLSEAAAAASETAAGLSEAAAAGSAGDAATSETNAAASALAASASEGNAAASEAAAGLSETAAAGSAAAALISEGNAATSESNAAASQAAAAASAAAVLQSVTVVADATSITPALVDESFKTVVQQVNTQALGPLTLNDPTGTPFDGQLLELRIKSTNIQTFSFGAAYRGSVQLTLPASSSGADKWDRFLFEYLESSATWDFIGVVSGA